MNKLFHSIIIIFVLSLALAAMPNNVAADGCIMMPDFSKYVYAPSQKAAIIWDGTTETLVLSTKIAMDEPQDVAWVVPIQSSTKPEVSEGDIDMFFRISSLLQPVKRGFGIVPLIGGTMQREDGVEVLEEKKVDIYDIAILRATSADVLVNWLNDNGYSTPQEAMTTLQYYVDRPNFYFIANKVNLENKYSNLTFTATDKQCADAIYSYYEKQLEFRGYYKPEYMIREIFEYPQYSEKEIQEACINNSATQESVKVLFDLKSGVATPLKIEFQPSQPFYPMKMTSINPGNVTANVYLFSNTPMTDSKGIMDVEKITTVDSWYQNQLNLTGQNFVTSFTYSGKTSQLVQDSVFQQAPYNCTKDPQCETADVIIMRFLGGLVIGFLMLIMGWFIFIPAIVGFLVGWKYRRGKPWKDRLIVFVILMIAETFVIWLFFSALLRAPYYIVPYVLLFSGPMTAIAYFPATMKWKEWKVILALIIIFVVSMATLFTVMY